ncbi:YfeK family protein [Marilutibacter alkalisoli]|uniref:DUF5329 domain-containing protein n=1 Tax=Marilutibacter alkalisoli TaxID=2591633 RepID=UPI00142062F7|nr:DUF5329 domain-containing protein [Lysobacter alkalisoli]
MRSILLLLLAFLSGIAAAQQSPPPIVSREIEQLFVALSQSDCQFYRNGSWHEAAEATAHLRRKYAYLLRKGLVSSAEAFIDRAASKSSTSGKPYLVRCGNATSIQSQEWFTGKLRELRTRRTGASSSFKPTLLRGAVMTHQFPHSSRG